MLKKSAFTMAVFWALLGAASGFAAGENLLAQAPLGSGPSQLLDPKLFNAYPSGGLQQPLVNSPFTQPLIQQPVLQQHLGGQQPMIIVINNNSGGFAPQQNQFPNSTPWVQDTVSKQIASELALSALNPKLVSDGKEVKKVDGDNTLAVSAVRVNLAKDESGLDSASLDKRDAKKDVEKTDSVKKDGSSASSAL